MTSSVLSTRSLNRATLARQLLLERTTMPAADVVELLVGMQAQVPTNPYVALWARLDPFQPDELGALLLERKAVRAVAMRATLHLFTARDYRWVRPLMQPVVARTFTSGSPFGRRLASLAIDDVIAAGRAELAERPMTAAQLGRRLQERWPSHDRTALAYAVQYLTPLVQVPPRGVWGRSLQATWALADDWLGGPLSDEGTRADLALRYLRAFGPASAIDMQAWCGLTHLRTVFDDLRPRLVTFRDERGRELFDLPDAPRPDPQTPSPPRLLPEYDNVLLGHVDRSRFGVEGRVIDISDAFWSMLLVDGVVGGTWKLLRDGRRTTLAVRLASRLSSDDKAAVEEEATRLLELIAADAATRDVRIMART